MNIGSILGRKFVIRKMLDYAENNLEAFTLWLNTNLDVPGLDEAAETELINHITSDAFTVLRNALEGGTGAYPISKRLIMTHVATWIATIGSTWAKNVQLPFISKRTDEAIDELVISLVSEDLMAYIESKF